MDSSKHTLYHNVETAKQLLGLGDRFSAEDADVTKDEWQQITAKLKHANIIEAVDTETVRRQGKKRTINVWTWKKGMKETLEQYLDGRDTLPCGHTWHIHNNGDSFGCKHCDKERKYTKQEVKDAKSGNGSRYNTKSIFSKEQLYELYWVDFLSTARIAEVLDVSKKTVRRHLVDYGIPRRTSNFRRDNAISPFSGFYNGPVPSNNGSNATQYDPEYSGV